VPVIREQVLRDHPEVAQGVAALAGKISDAEMRQLNYAVDGQHRDVKEVVHSFLKGKRLVP
jgi:glycine betaine/choline ABC-type transport system substrate-binding protein